jgi:hypothetical protein
MDKIFRENLLNYYTSDFEEERGHTDWIICGIPTYYLSESGTTFAL